MALKDAVPLWKLSQIGEGERLFIYGTGKAGQRMYRGLSLLTKARIDGFIDSSKSGAMNGVRIFSLEEFKTLEPSNATIIVASSYFDEIFAGIRNITWDRCLDARSMIDLFLSYKDDETSLQLDDGAFALHFLRTIERGEFVNSIRHSSAPYDVKARYDAVERPHYAYVMLRAADMAAQLGITDISVLEFGVAGGRGLIAMEAHAAEIEKLMPVRLHIFGFDAATGLPASKDYRDHLNIFQAGDYPMEEGRLRSKLTRSELILGDVKETVVDFLGRPNIPTIGCCVFDLDYYTSTMDAFALFDSSCERYLPRVPCYFDDVGFGENYHEFAGELLAIADFNDAHSARKIAKIHNFRHVRPIEADWNDQIYIAHIFDHEHYKKPLREQGQVSRLPLF